MTDVEAVVLRGLILAAIAGTSIASERRTKLIPNAITLGGLGATLVSAAFDGQLLDALGGLVIVAVPFLFAFSRRWIQGGGAKLAIAMGACIGIVGAPVLVLGSVVVRAFWNASNARKLEPRHTSPWLTFFSVLGFALSVAKVLSH